jgi:hypothetical protein
MTFDEYKQAIYDKFDFVKKSLDGSMLPFAMFYLEIGDGWLPLVYDLFCKIENELEANPELRENFRISQLKEKFAGLRCYTYGASEKINDLISEAEDLSFHTCEQCSKPGSIRPTGWVVTLCKDCFGKYIKKSWKRIGFRTKINYFCSLLTE